MAHAIKYLSTDIFMFSYARTWRFANEMQNKKSVHRNSFQFGNLRNNGNVIINRDETNKQMMLDL